MRVSADRTLLEKLRDALADRREVAFAYLFGSRSGGRSHPLSDVDVVLLQRAPPLLAERIARTGTLIGSRDEARRVRWLVETKSRYCDLGPLRRLLDRAVAERVRSGRFGTRG